jgi:hypothetical protein
MFHVSFSPIVSWPFVAVAAALVVALTLWAYRLRLRGTSGRTRWVALALRLAAVLLCLLAAVRPSVVLMQKVKQVASIVFLIDASGSMAIADEAGARTRFAAASKGLADGVAAVKSLKVKPPPEIKTYRFAEGLKEPSPGDPAEPDGKQSALGTALVEALKRQSATKLVAVVVLSDGASNAGLPPINAAQKLRAAGVPVVAVGYGSETAGEASRDLAVRDLDCAPTVFIKNELQVRGTIRARGYSDQPIDVELYAEDRPVGRTRVRASNGAEVIAIKDLKWIPDTIGETKLTLKVVPKPGELVKTNNELATYVTVKKGGLNALYLKANFSWETRYLVRALDPAGEIRVDVRELRRPAQGEVGALNDRDLAPGQYDVYILDNLPADHLTKSQQRLLQLAVERGAGLIMLGGHASFGAGGWANSPVADILPTEIHPGDGQIEPENGLKVLPNATGLESFVMKIGSTRADTERLWAALPPITGANNLGRPKELAVVLARTPAGEPLMVGMDVGKGRVLGFGGETWAWARASDETREAHRKFWRQAVLWLAHKEDQGENQVRLLLDRRRVATGQKIELTATARDAKNEPIPDVSYETTVELMPKDLRSKPQPAGTPPPLYNQGAEARGTYFAANVPGEYRITAKAMRNGQAVGSDSARFLVYQDDREMENPAADLKLLRQVAEMTDGKTLPPEQLGKYLKSLDTSALTDSYSQREHRVWDNWPFFLIFTALLSIEWCLRKRMGWV